MRTWVFPLVLRPQRGQPLFAQIARAIADDIRRGRLRPGARLPGSRELARTLLVHRNTVVAAYNELEAEGWIDAAKTRGTFVSPGMPETPPGAFSRRASFRGAGVRAGFDLPPRAPLPAGGVVPPGVLPMPGGLPDVRLVPTAPLARAYRRALKQHGPAVLGYNDARGHPRLRAALAALLAGSRGLAGDADDVLVTRGSQMALSLVARTLFSPGDVVAVEAPGYPPAWQAFTGFGARLEPLPVDAHGIDVSALAALTRRMRVRAVYTTPHHHYPTTVTLSASRRLALLDLARRSRIAIIEDDYDHEFHYEGRPVLPLASADPAAVVVYIGTLTKVLAPGLRLGYIVASRDLIDRVAAHRFTLDRQGDHAIECAVAELIEDGEVQRHVRRVRRVYQARRDFLADALRRTFPSALSFEVPPGGMAFWTTVAPDVDPEAWAARALKRGVLFLPGRHFTFDRRPIPHARFGFAALDEEELELAVRRLSATLRAREPARGGPRRPPL